MDDACISRRLCVGDEMIDEIYEKMPDLAGIRIRNHCYSGRSHRNYATVASQKY